MRSPVPDEPEHVLINTEILAIQVREKFVEKRGPVPEIVAEMVDQMITDVVIMTVNVLIEDLHLGHRLDE